MRRSELYPCAVQPRARCGRPRYRRQRGEADCPHDKRLRPYNRGCARCLRQREDASASLRVAADPSRSRSIRRASPAHSLNSSLELLAVIDGKKAERSFAKPHSLCEHLIEHRREVTRRGIDDLQNLGGGGLLLQGFACLSNEPRILHRNDRLASEVLQKGDLFFRERAYPVAMGTDIAE